MLGYNASLVIEAWFDPDMIVQPSPGAVIVAPVFETDTAFPITWTPTAVQVNQVAETDTAMPITYAPPPSPFNVQGLADGTLVLTPLADS